MNSWLTNNRIPVSAFGDIAALVLAGATLDDAKAIVDSTRELNQIGRTYMGFLLQPAWRETYTFPCPRCHNMIAPFLFPTERDPWFCINCNAIGEWTHDTGDHRFRADDEDQ